MARVTVEDCIEKIPNRFDLVLAAAQRARAVSSGNPLTIDRDNDKNPVVALREIADETIDPDFLRDEIIKSLQKLSNPEVSNEDEEDELEENRDIKYSIGASSSLCIWGPRIKLFLVGLNTKGLTIYNEFAALG